MKPIFNLHELERQARTQLTQMAYDFIAGGADDELTLRANSEAWRALRLAPRMLAGVAQRQLGTSVLGHDIAFPVLVAPMGYQCLAAAEGEVATARGAAQAGTVYVLSTTSTRSIEEVATAGAASWFQLYVYKDRGITRELVARAAAAGYKALCLTVDSPREGWRERDQRNQFHLPPGLSLKNFEGMPGLADLGSSSGASALTSYIDQQWDAGLCWHDVDWLAGLSPLPLAVKGVLGAHDALAALDHGARAVIVSNHGGRQLDGVPATAEVLPAIAAAMDGRGELLVDGGIRRGTDVLKALALGARAVLLGRPVYWGLALDGADGVHAVLQHLRDEFDLAMALAGCRTVADITPDRIWQRPGRRD